MGRYFEPLNKLRGGGTINVPARQTKHAAGYDFEASEDVTIYSQSVALTTYQVWLGQLIEKASKYLAEDERFEGRFEKELEKVVNNHLREDGKMDDEGTTLYLGIIAEVMLEAEGMDMEDEVKKLTKAFSPTLVPTGVKCKLEEDEYLALFNRSSNPLKQNLVLANGTGVIDSDYYNNPDNEGHIMFQYYNFGTSPVHIKKGDRIGQGVFQKFLIVDNDEVLNDAVRVGGHGSSGK